MTNRGLTIPMLLVFALPGWLHLPTGVERWLHNPGERTRVAIQDVEHGETERAASALETAADLTPGDPLVLYNAGTGRMLSGKGDPVAPLARAAQALDDQPGQAADAWYNLGTARLKKHDPQGAVQALTQALRRDPKDRDAKFNLELAQAQLKRQRQAEKREAEQHKSGVKKNEKQRQGNKNDKTGPEQKGDSGAERTSQSSSEHSQGATGTPPAQEEKKSQDNPLPQFEAQPDMTAKQAASILEAVENLEREQRRAAAEQQIRRLPNGGKDW